MERKNSNISVNISLSGFVLMVLVLYGILEYDNKYEFLIPYMVYVFLIFIITMIIAVVLVNNESMVLGMIVLSISCLSFLVMIIMFGLLSSTVLANLILIAIHNISNIFR